MPISKLKSVSDDTCHVVRLLASLLLSAPAGVLADRYDRRLLMIIGDSLSAVGLVFILACMVHGEALLWQICVGVSNGSVFSSLLEPSYRATVTDMLTDEQYTRASGLVQTASSAKYLISPNIAGYLLAVPMFLHPFYASARPW